MAGASNPFDMSRMAIGGIGQMFDGVELVRRAWSTLNMPSTLVPTVDIGELDKRIADLKAVEQWLNLNLGMLHGTIQALEIQRGTLAAVQAFGSTFGNLQAAGAGGASEKPADRAARAPAPAPAAAATEPGPAPGPATGPATGSGAGRSGGQHGAKADAKAGDPAASAAAMLQGINPTAWWNLLQQNFNQVAEAALSGVGLQNAAADAMKAAAGTAARKPASGAARESAKKAAPARRQRAPAKRRAPKATS